MKVYDLQCAAGHNFEGWFDDLAELEQQIEQGMISCPACGLEDVRRIPSSFAIKGKRSEVNPQAAANMVGKAFMRYLHENFDDVGPQFAKEALKIHYGVSEPRDIRGVSTPDEEKMLADEGIDFFKVGPAKPEPNPVPAASPPESSDDDDD
jgi:hypothetical protein